MKLLADGTLITSPGRLSYPHLLERNSAGEFPSDMYETLFLIPKTTDISLMIKVAQDCHDEKFPKTKKDVAQLKHPPIRDGDEKEDTKGYWIIKAKSANRPQVVGPNPKVVIDDPEQIYGGQNARLSIRCFAYDKAGSKGVSWGLRNVQILGGGERFGGGSGDPTEQFDEVKENAANDNF